jgi:hypothetical protein
MIREEKIHNAFAAIQQIFISARSKIGDGEDSKMLYDLMDGAEYLAGLALRSDDQTDKFYKYLKMLCENHNCMNALRAYER